MRLTDSQIVEMRELCEKGVSRQELAERFGIDAGQTSRLVRGETRPEAGGPLAKKLSHRDEASWYDIHPETGCWVWNGRLNPGGYAVHATAHDHGYSQLGHRYFYEKYVGPVPEGLEVDHLCRNRACVNPKHLEPVTPAVNSQRASSTKLTAERVKEIRDLYSTGEFSQHQLARKLGITRAMVQQVVTSTTWQDPNYQREVPSHQKLTSAQVVEMRELYATGNFFHKDLAQRFGINPSQVCVIVRGKQWKDVGGPIDPGRKFKPKCLTSDSVPATSSGHSGDSKTAE